MQNISVVGLAVVCAFLTAAGQITLKVGVSSSALADALVAGNHLEFFARAAKTPLVVGGLALYGSSAAMWLLVLARADVSFAFPLVSLGFVFTALYGHFALHEPISAMRIGGIALIVLGVAFVSNS